MPERKTSATVCRQELAHVLNLRLPMNAQFKCFDLGACWTWHAQLQIGAAAAQSCCAAPWLLA